MSKKPIMLPRIVYQMCVNGALIVGSFAKKLAGEKIKSHDYDLLVPPEKWQLVAILIPMTAKPNKFGGWRFVDSQSGKEIDVWPSSLEKYLTECKSKYGGEVIAVDFINNRKFASSFIKEI